MLPEFMVGTRTRQNFANSHPPQQHLEQSYTRDVGMSKNVTASITFTASTKKLTAANGTFAAFALNDMIAVSKTNKNDGFFTVVAIDGVNSSFLTVDAPCNDEGPLSATVRTV